MKRKSIGSRSAAKGRGRAGNPSVEECIVWRDDEIEVEFPPTLAGNAMLHRQTYGDDGLGYSLRYGAYGTGAGSPHFDLYVYDHGQCIPDDEGGVFRIHVAEMVNTLVAISDPRNPAAEDGRFPDQLSGGQFDKTGIHYLSIQGSYRCPESGAVFGTAIVIFPFRGKFIKIRYSEPWSEKTPDTFEETFERIERNLLEGRPNLFNRVADFLESLDGLLFGSLPRERKELLQASSLLEIPPDSDEYGAELAGELKKRRAEASGVCTDRLRKQVARAVAVFKKHRKQEAAANSGQATQSEKQQGG